ncbi:Piso0_005895 [Millerozyma farinosa CBS 7064]|uniref:Piso0_005895 protein n=1 Tax=Pichia sorbitophila (strain ATCC MYA-4447 / BCRC 22081 / CBS 7064 / NBRC 10061 / NRRL Y-12695) TaxID=559304 RepID=G8Y376_PICSO|nr:Piso0_005895 [Millerozyma farinosa CBS 7064]
MSNSKVGQVQRILSWLEYNAFWNSKVLEVKQSKVAGLGVFLKGSVQPGDVIFRIPKDNILSAKNGLIYNMLRDYDVSNVDNERVSISQGMFGLIITFIYETASGQDSPWYDYIKSIEPEADQIDQSDIPICLWPEKEKRFLDNTECGISGMLDNAELIEYYLECVRFAQRNRELVRVPDVLDIDSKHVNTKTILDQYKTKVLRFGQYVQAVISRAFNIDDYHEIALVPGADLFNSVAPSQVLVDGDSIVKGNENIRFICEGDGKICEICGQIGCDHEEILSDVEEIEAYSEVSEDQGNSDEDNDGEESQHEDSDVSSQNDEESSTDKEDEEILTDENDNKSDDEDLLSEIDMEYIEKMEREIKEEEMNDSDDDSAIGDNTKYDLESSISDKDSHEQRKAPEKAALYDLSNSLEDTSQCCDIILVNLPNREDSLELFNTYGNFLPNCYLLQKYGYINTYPNPNPNDKCTLQRQLSSYLKHFKKNLSSVKQKQMEHKLEWYEDIAFDIVNEIVMNHTASMIVDKVDLDDDDKEDFLQSAVPESWKLSATIGYNGIPSKQTYAILRLVHLPYKIFNLKLANVKSEKTLNKRIRELLVFSTNDSDLSKINTIIKSWVQERLSLYKGLPREELSSSRLKIIHHLITSESAILNRAIAKLDT